MVARQRRARNHAVFPSPLAHRLLRGRHPPTSYKKLRLRITRALSGSIDGIQLDQFRPGYVYAVGTSIGSYLLAIAAAEPVADDTVPVVLPPEKQLFGPVVTGRSYRPVVAGRPVVAKRGDRPSERAVAADSDPKSRKKR